MVSHEPFRLAREPGRYVSDHATPTSSEDDFYLKKVFGFAPTIGAEPRCTTKETLALRTHEARSAELVNHDKIARLLSAAGSAVLADRLAEGERLIREKCPHSPRARTRRSASKKQKLSVWISDGFRCRYSGDLLLFPGYLTCLSLIWPQTFPAHPNGKAEHAHDAYWTHFASLEHVGPVCTGGTDTEDNWVTTSMARNQVRSRYPLEALGWGIRPREILPDWDGGLQQFRDLIATQANFLIDPRWGAYLRRWQTAVEAVLQERGGGGSR